jgi:hypothetical protein
MDDIATLYQVIRKTFDLSPATDFQLLIGLPPKLLEATQGMLCTHGITAPQVVLLSNLPSSTSSSSSKPKSSASKPTKRAPAAAARKPSQEEEEDSDYDEDEEDAPKKRKPPPRKKATSFLASNTIKRGPAAAAAKKKPRTMEGLGESLAQAHEAGNATRETDYFRKLTKSQVALQYEIAACEAKFAAVLCGDFEIFASTSASTFRLSDGAAMETKLLVKYRKGPKSFATEEVSGLSLEVLEATVGLLLQEAPSNDPEDAFLHPRERLRPHVLPMASPRVFWSLVHHFGGGDNCIPKALVALLPDYDWSFLEVRVRLPSQLAKAAERTEAAFEVDDGLVQVGFLLFFGWREDSIVCCSAICCV